MYQAKVNEGVLKGMSRIDKATTSDTLEQGYQDVTNRISEARHREKASIANATHGELADIQSRLDSLIHSKQYGREYSELIVLTIFAVIILSIALLTRPDATGTTGFFVDMFAMLFAAAVTFLTVNIIDLRIDRRMPVLEKSTFLGNGASQMYGVHFRKDGARLEWTISIMLCVAMVIMYGILLYSKWLS